MSRLKKMKTGFISFGKTGSACIDWARPMVGAMSAMSARNAGFQKLSNSLSFKCREGFLLKKEPKETESGQEVLRIRPAKPFLDCIVN